MAFLPKLGELGLRACVFLIDSLFAKGFFWGLRTLRVLIKSLFIGSFFLRAARPRLALFFWFRPKE